jgi:hypothetical protein
MSARLSCPRVSEQLPMDGLREIWCWWLSLKTVHKSQSG